MKHRTTIVAVLAAVTALNLGVALGGSNAHAGPERSPEPGEFVLVEDGRALDTRGGEQLAAGHAVAVDTGLTEAQAVAVTITVDRTAGPGYVTAWDFGGPPNTSVLAVDRAGATESGFAIVPVTYGRFQVYASMDTDVIVDVVGYIASGETATKVRLP